MINFIIGMVVGAFLTFGFIMLVMAGSDRES